jgi:D-serine deaminase-like pyridoxal phosphate-dependent protein
MSSTTDAGAPTTTGDLFGGDVAFPQLVVRWDDVLHNIRVVHGHIRAAGASIAPHGKTSMSPEIFAAQLAGDTWGMTVATARQALVARAAGATRILIANQVVDDGGLRTLVSLARDPSLELLVLADSVAGVERLAAAARGSVSRPIQVLVELGIPGGRTGARGRRELEGVVAAIEAAGPMLEVRGYEGFEGIIGIADALEQVAAVDAFLDQLAEVARTMRDRVRSDDPIVSAGGSVFPDRVLERLAPDRVPGYRLVLRSGGYVTHDSRFYEERSPFAASSPRFVGGAPLRPALELWAAVLACPEPGRAILGFGHREAPSRLALPIPMEVRRLDGVLEPITGRASIEGMFDHHAYLRADSELGLSVGEHICLGVSHPCEAFERWRLLLTIDQQRTVTGTIHTEF